ncbi:ligase-associated DNA damage response endonuclease PdeM [Chelativorans sp. ZYF759]|uniref:ligase-associated DNA damage response endonuclease PdeM n=1 Tax=Chelativorans sp. ZYF759 TaxID=2692213 RepID=UPI00145DF9A1|nr:ligase-associated DNA damage response endonuclease PdeM [Chelativorans sp. ZYF759]NMG41042.1 ligase-associated DNA damage response endonuclease PdeM [Chelativorans sp. ZYF759]
MNLAVRREETSGEFELAGEACRADIRGALFLVDARVLIVSDLHLEKGAAKARRGHLVPPYDTAATLNLLERSLALFDPRSVICLGDSFDDAGGSSAMPRLFRDRLATLMAGRDWFWIEGNHDPLPPEGLGGDSVRAMAVGGLNFVHHPSAGSVHGEVAGHLHPGARIVRRGRSVRRRCFATDGARMIMPAYGAYTGALNLRDRAFAGMFREDGLVAWALGADRLYRLPASELMPG